MTEFGEQQDEEPILKKLIREGKLDPRPTGGTPITEEQATRIVLNQINEKQKEQKNKK